jgi:glycine/D-amino acid oxidase-like deaminating enzyme
LGARLFAETRLTRLNRGSPTDFRTDGDRNIDAQHVIFATGYETPEEFPEVYGLCRLSSIYALATHPLPPQCIWPQRALIWDTGNPYLYARTGAGGRVIIGGKDEPFSNAEARDGAIAQKVKALLEGFEIIHSLGRPQVETAWAGTFAAQEDGLPYIGMYPAYPEFYFALGYGGNGITFSLIAAQMIRDAILRRPNPATRVFSFQRLQLAHRKRTTSIGREQRVE